MGRHALVGSMPCRTYKLPTNIVCHSVSSPTPSTDLYLTSCTTGQGPKDANADQWVSKLTAQVKHETRTFDGNSLAVLGDLFARCIDHVPFDGRFSLAFAMPATPVPNLLVGTAQFRLSFRRRGPRREVTKEAVEPGIPHATLNLPTLLIATNAATVLVEGSDDMVWANLTIEGFLKTRPTSSASKFAKLGDLCKDITDLGSRIAATKVWDTRAALADAMARASVPIARDFADFLDVTRVSVTVGTQVANKLSALSVLKESASFDVRPKAASSEESLAPEGDANDTESWPANEQPLHDFTDETDATGTPPRPHDQHNTVNMDRVNKVPTTARESLALDYDTESSSIDTTHNLSILESEQPIEHPSESSPVIENGENANAAPLNTVDGQADVVVTSSKPMKRGVVIALGSNMGDRVAEIERACRAIDADPDMRIVDTSCLYETDAMYVEDQDRFVNGACEVSKPSGRQVYIDLC